MPVRHTIPRVMRTLQRWTGRATVCALVAVGQPAPAPAPAGPLTLRDAVDLALTSNPSIQGSAAEEDAAAGEVALARADYLPSAETRLGFNRATRNNVFGLILPNSVIPAISGPVLSPSSDRSTFGSSAGILFSWEPVDFGLRGANVRAAEAGHRRAEAGLASTRLEVSVAVARAYLTSLAARQAVTAAEATVERMRLFAEAVGALVRNELRPGADESRAHAELARAQIEQVRAEQEAESALATLAESIGLAGERLGLRPAGLQGEPPAALVDAPPRPATLDEHPAARVQAADVGAAEARREAEDKQWRPTLELQTAVYGRGTGAGVDGTFEEGGAGLAPSETNWAVGFNVSFDLFGFGEHRARQAIAAGEAAQARAREDRVTQRLRADLARAEITVDAARRVAAQTPVALDAARTLEAQARARYRAGLGTVVEVAEAQRLLRQAEVDDAVARLELWRALLEQGAASGDIEPLLAASSH